VNVYDEIDKYRRANPYMQRTLGPRLMRIANKMTKDIRKLETWLTEAHRRLPMDRRSNLWTPKDEAREELWLKKYAEYMRLLKMREMIGNTLQ
jgi:hypothetical protein